MVPKLSQMAIPWPSPAGSGVPHADIPAAFSSTALEARLPGQQAAPELSQDPRACGVRHLVDERLLEEAVLRVEDRAPLAGSNRVRRVPLLGALFRDGDGMATASRLPPPVVA
ncbi:MAG: hypothetical protein R2708_28935 [Vicinamibacterales bacterium]